MTGNTKYDLRGVSADKTDIHNAIKGLDKGLFPNCFCKILPDIVAGDDSYCNIMHADTAGTKTSLAYIYWKETGDNSVWKGIVQDAIVMNIDDMACVGATDNIVISSTIGRNKNLITGEVIEHLIKGTADYIYKLTKSGINVYLSGGETADVGDIVRTLDVGITAFARMKREQVIENNICDGDVIIGLSSSGQASYENEYNGGMGSNGLTSARHDVLDRALAEKYPESFDPCIPGELIYSGNKQLTDIEEETGMPIGKLLLSPTRTYTPVIKRILDKYRSKIHGIIHCTGGGQTKVLNFVENLHIIKDDMFDIPPLFKLIQNESGTSLQEMYKVFNMGHRMEIYAAPEEAQTIINISKELNVDAKVIGRCEKAITRSLTIKTEDGEFVYS
ncbi:MAG: AIR synthase related protein [Bacteroidota bacterium]